MNASPPAAEQYAKKSAAPGMPSEEEIRQIVDAALNSAIPEPWEVSAHATQRILSLTRPAFEAMDAKADRLAESVGRLSVQLDAAETKLAQAVGALRHLKLRDIEGAMMPERLRIAEAAILALAEEKEG